MVQIARQANDDRFPDGNHATGRLVAGAIKHDKVKLRVTTVTQRVLPVPSRVPTRVLATSALLLAAFGGVNVHALRVGCAVWRCCIRRSGDTLSASSVRNSWSMLLCTAAEWAGR